MRFNKNYLLGLFLVSLVCISTVNADVSYTHCAFKLPHTVEGKRFLFALDGGRDKWILAGPSEHNICLPTRGICSISWKYDYESSALQSIPGGTFRLGESPDSILKGQDGKITSLKLFVPDYSWRHYNESLFTSRKFWFGYLSKSSARTINNEQKIEKMEVTISFSNINGKPAVKLARRDTRFGKKILDDQPITIEDLASGRFLGTLDISGDQISCKTSDELIHGPIEDPEDIKKSTQHPATSILRPASGLGSFNKPSF